MQNTRQIPQLNSRRSFYIYLSNSVDVPFVKTLDGLIYESLVEDWEYAHSLMEDIDLILDMKVNETMYFRYDRNDPESKSIIKRIQ